MVSLATDFDHLLSPNRTPSDTSKINSETSSSIPTMCNALPFGFNIFLPLNLHPPCPHPWSLDISTEIHIPVYTPLIPHTKWPGQCSLTYSMERSYYSEHFLTLLWGFSSTISSWLYSEVPGMIQHPCLVITGCSIPHFYHNYIITPLWCIWYLVLSFVISFILDQPLSWPTLIFAG